MRPSTRTWTWSGAQLVEQALVVGDQHDAHVGAVGAHLA